eukprot:14831395-Ditylum_brightwellii.AAC.1
MHNDPEAITKKYDFQEFKQSYPIIPALCLGASYEVVDMMINTFPEAVQGEGDILHTVCSGDYDVNAEALGRLIECCPDAVQKQNCKGNTALHIACESGAAFGVVKVLITKHTKALVMKNNRAETPLHLACIRDAPLNVIQLLLSKSPSSLWIQNCNGRTPLMCAEHWNASEDVVDYILVGCARCRASKEGCNVDGDVQGIHDWDLETLLVHSSLFRTSIISTEKQRGLRIPKKSYLAVMLNERHFDIVNNNMFKSRWPNCDGSAVKTAPWLELLKLAV